MSKGADRYHSRPASHHLGPENHDLSNVGKRSCATTRPKAKNPLCDAVVRAIEVRKRSFADGEILWVHTLSPFTGEELRYPGLPPPRLFQGSEGRKMPPSRRAVVWRFVHIFGSCTAQIRKGHHEKICLKRQVWSSW